MPRSSEPRQSEEKSLCQKADSVLFLQLLDEDSLSGRAESVFSWNELGAGDCTLRGGSTLSFRADGSFEFRGIVKSSDTNDTWEMHFVLLDGTDVFLSHLPVLGPHWHYDLRIPEKDTWYDRSFAESNSILFVPKDIVPRIRKVRMEFSC